MTITINLADAEGGTEILAVHDGLPRGLAPADNETGCRMPLAKLAALAEDERVRWQSIATARIDRKRFIKLAEKGRHAAPAQIERDRSSAFRDSDLCVEAKVHRAGVIRAGCLCGSRSARSRLGLDDDIAI